MKSDREFLNGVYARAEILQQEKKTENRRKRSYYQYSSVAALIILLSFFTFKDKFISPQPMETNFNLPKEAKILLLDYREYFDQADEIILGEISKNGDLEVKESFVASLDGRINLVDLDDLESGKIIVFLIKDGQSYLPLTSDSYFYQIQEDVFQDSFGNKISIQDIKDNIRRKIK